MFDEGVFSGSFVINNVMLEYMYLVCIFWPS